MTERKDAIIIGAGPAGVVAAETLRKLDSDGEITIIGDEPATLTIRTDLHTCGRLAIGWSLVGPEGASREDALDAMGEFANVVGGSVKFCFESESHLGLPEVEILDEASDVPDLVNPVVILHQIGRIEIQLVNG